MLDYPECEACYYESLEFADRQQGKLHFDHTLLYPVLLALVLLLKQLHEYDWELVVWLYCMR